MSLTKICCICGIRKDSRKSKEKNSRVFFYFPNRDRKDKGVSGQYAQKLLETRLAARKNVVGSNLEKCKTGVACVCSDHFHSGKVLINPNYTFALIFVSGYFSFKTKHITIAMVK